MYLHLGNNVSVPMEDIIGIFDLDNASTSRITRQFLRAAEEDGMVITVGHDLPKLSFLLQGIKPCPVGSIHILGLAAPRISCKKLQRVRPDGQGGFPHGPVTGGGRKMTTEIQHKNIRSFFSL